MNKKLNPDLTLIQFMLRVQHIARQADGGDKGYAMMITSIISVLMLSMLAAYMTLTNLTKSSTNAYVDVTNTFYAAESGLNQRAEQLRQQFIGYATPDGLSPGQATTASVVTAANMSNCFSVSTNTAATSDDFECRNYPFRYNNNSATVNASNNKDDLGGSTAVTNQTQTINYTAYTFVADKTNYVNNTNTTVRAPVGTPIPSGDIYAGLNAQEYKYIVYATAAKPDPTNTTQPLRTNDAKTVLEMAFKSRVIPLFQFAAFYNGDLEMNSTSNMTLSGWVHTNSNLYVQPFTTSSTISTTFLSRVTAAGSIYNRVDSSNTGTQNGITRVLITGNNCTSGSCTSFPAHSLSFSNSLSAATINSFSGKVKDGTAGAVVLKTPPPGFLRKRNYLDNSIGEYYAKADMRLEMVPDRDVTDKTATPWTRDKARIPFNFTAITTGGSGSCSTTAPTGTDPLTAGLPSIAKDPVANYIDSTRQNASTLHCNVFTKGQLQSLRQPVLVLNNTNTALQTAENTTLGRPGTLPTPPTLSGTANTLATKTKILRALQVALASTPTPVPFDILSQPFSNTAYTTFGNPAKSFKDEFTRLIGTIPTSTLPAADVTVLTASTVTPNQIAALLSAWFLPAPVQRVESTNIQEGTTNNRRSSGFYDGRERRWITMLQTNIASLSVWNRDGVYVEGTDTNLTTAYASSNTLKDTAFSNVTGTTSTASFTNGLAFDRAAADSTKPAGTLQYLGLGSADTTEGGLVFHATVSDDLDGDGTIAAANDVKINTANPIYKTNSDGTNTTVSLDYPRMYAGSTNSYQSPFGFAFNGGNYLPAPMTLVTDQAIYVQGDFNNNGATQPPNAINTPDPNRLPASIIGDTITTLSNQCTNNTTTSTASTTNHLGVPAGQLNCGLPRSTTGSVNVTVGGNTASYYSVTGPTAVNAAFLSYTRRSNGNLGTGRGYGTTPTQYSGGLNNYMRMLENWGQAQYFNYSGSFVSLGTPLEYSGNYVSGGGGSSYYNIPVRNFNFDLNFNAFSNMPPLAPRVIYLQQDVFKRTYN